MHSLYNRRKTGPECLSSDVEARANYAYACYREVKCIVLLCLWSNVALHRTPITSTAPGPPVGAPCVLWNGSSAGVVTLHTCQATALRSFKGAAF